jgi:hypothetical protein
MNEPTIEEIKTWWNNLPPQNRVNLSIKYEKVLEGSFTIEEVATRLYHLQKLEQQ